MPQFLNLNFLERFPVPSLRNYVLFSGALLATVLFYAEKKVSSPEDWEEVKGQFSQSTISNHTKEMIDKFVGIRMAYFMLSDNNCIWVIVNTVCCLVAVWGWFLKRLVFGKLRALEQQHLRDRFWNFVFYKFVFMFGVVNVQYVDEVLMWSGWFIVVGFYYILTTLAQDRFKYVSSAVNSSKGPLWKIIILMAFTTLSATSLIAVAATLATKIGFNFAAFLAADAVLLVFRSMYCLCKYGAQVYDLGQEAIWEKRHSFIYFSELIFEVLILFTDFLHHIHMLVWSNIFLSMASLVICMQLRALYQELDRRLKRHRNYRRVVEHMDKHFPMVPKEELEANEDNTCAICWDSMEAARKLPCGHLFHNWCLRGWLEQDTSCPTCRLSLGVSGGANVVGGQENRPQEPRPPRRRFNHFFHFDGGRYARWLPAFSVEVSHNIGIGIGTRLFNRRRPANNSQFNAMAEQIREMFPNVELRAILNDLEETGSADATVENILEGRLHLEGEEEADGQDAGDGEETDHSTDDSDANEYEEDIHSFESEESDFMPEEDEVIEGGGGPTPFSDPPTPPNSQSSSVPPLSSVPSTSSSFTSLSAHELPTSSSGSRFSKCSSERESILMERKHQLLDRSRKKYLESERGKEFINKLNLVNSSEAKPDASENGFHDALPSTSTSLRHRAPQT